jgi:hypothetical protein
VAKQEINVIEQIDISDEERLDLLVQVVMDVVEEELGATS